MTRAESPSIQRTRTPRRLPLQVVAVIAGAVFSVPAVAHEFTITDVVVFFKNDGTYQIDVTVDVDALALGVPPSTPSDEVAAALRALPEQEFAECVQQARRTITTRTRVRFDGDAYPPGSIVFPQYVIRSAPADEVVPRSDPPQGPPSVLGIIARLTGIVPEDSHSFTFWASRAFKAVHLTIIDETVPGTGSAASVPAQRRATVRHILDVGEESPVYRMGQADQPESGSVVLEYLVLGFKHIAGFEGLRPLGLDHILFVLGLFLLSTRWRPLMWQITAFTVAHTATLAMSILDIISLPSRLVESLIALSIAYVAVENLLTSELKPWRPFVVFGFGLLHGLGFAGVLRELGLPDGELATALVSFNIGVELGQIAVVASAFVLVGWLRGRPSYRRRIVLPASAVIALVGLYWAVERALVGV